MKAHTERHWKGSSDSKPAAGLPSKGRSSCRCRSRRQPSAQGWCGQSTSPASPSWVAQLAAIGITKKRSVTTQLKDSLFLSRVDQHCATEMAAERRRTTRLNGLSRLWTHTDWMRRTKALCYWNFMAAALNHTAQEGVTRRPRPIATAPRPPGPPRSAVPGWPWTQPCRPTPAGRGCWSPSRTAGRRREPRGRAHRLAVGETVILLHPPLSLLGVSIEARRECRQDDRLAKWLPPPADSEPTVVAGGGRLAPRRPARPQPRILRSVRDEPTRENRTARNSWQIAGVFFCRPPLAAGS